MKETKMTNREIIKIINDIQAMQQREEKDATKVFGNRVKVNYAVRKNKEHLIRLIKPYEEERAELQEKYRTTHGKEIRKDCIKQWNSEITQLLDIEIDAKIHTIPFSEIEGLELSMNDMEAIDFMVEPPGDFEK